MSAATLARKRGKKLVEITIAKASQCAGWTHTFVEARPWRLLALSHSFSCVVMIIIAEGQRKGTMTSYPEVIALIMHLSSLQVGNYGTDGLDAKIECGVRGDSRLKQCC